MSVPVWTVSLSFNIKVITLMLSLYHCPLKASTASSAMAASTGCTRNAVGSSALKKTLTTDVHSARELHAPWMADHRRKSRSDLTSLRW